MSEVRLQAAGRDGAVTDLTIHISEAAPWSLTIEGEGGPTERFTGRDLFDALVTLRRALEARGLMLLCAGARPDVHPSGMSRDMGAGRFAYRSPIGGPAEPARIDIFAPASRAEVDTVDAQIDYRQRWVESLKRLVDDAAPS